MLRSIVGIAAGTLVLGVTGVRPAHALANDQVIKAHLPFAFQVRGEHMPAGEYEIKPLDFNEPGVVEIRSLDGSAAAGLFLTLPKPGDRVENPHLVFDDVGKQKFLRAVLFPGEDGIQLPVDRVEVQAARAVAAASVHKTSQPASGS